MLTLRRTALLLPLALAVAGCRGSSSSDKKPPPVAVEAVQVGQQPIAEIVRGGGTIFPLRQASLAPKISSPVRAFYASRGQHVHRGQLLAVLENEDLAGAAVSAEGGFDQARANYTKVVTSSLPEEIQAAQLGVKDSDAALVAQQKLYDSYLWLYQQHAGARKQVDQADAALVQARSQAEGAKKKLADLESSGSTVQTHAAQGQVESARGQYLAAKAQLEYTHLRSPIAGVVADRSVYPGDIAQAGTPLLIVMDVSRVYVRLHLPHPQSALLKLGDVGQIRIPGIEVPVACRVAVISPALDPNSTTVEVWVEASNPNNNLQPGTSVQVNLVARVVPDALVIPLTAVLTDSNGAHSVMAIARDNTARRQPITTGIENNGVVQVVAGLKPGMMIIATGAYGLPDNTEVKPSPGPKLPPSGAPTGTPGFPEKLLPLTASNTVASSRVQSVRAAADPSASSLSSTPSNAARAAGGKR